MSQTWRQLHSINSSEFQFSLSSPSLLHFKDQLQICPAGHAWPKVPAMGELSHLYLPGSFLYLSRLSWTKVLSRTLWQANGMISSFIAQCRNRSVLEDLTPVDHLVFYVLLTNLEFAGWNITLEVGVGVCWKRTQIKKLRMQPEQQHWIDSSRT